MTFILSHQVLDDILQAHRVKGNDLAAIDKLFGGADGYYWYHTLRHMCPKKEVMVWHSAEQMRAAVQGHEDETAAEDEVKPQALKDEHLAALTRLLALPS
ncbi:MAG: hypothetical protein JWP65_3340 [Ramlibacter sp.]|jgi:hypothetical protein|uniref:hypothetical protein n=1 Tax=Ramlibacter sp. TaxID=1917967 RepID=UPI0026188469|nr:hypothetical protein [Ramlibacter sp.]MDB5752919.1 hypothetical protein [Ramlibacter sp.]